LEEEEEEEEERRREIEFAAAVSSQARYTGFRIWIITLFDYISPDVG
jgi:hypothetical protein